MAKINSAATESTSRTYGEIMRSNVATLFNAILGTLFVLILVFGSPQDALFGFVLVANALIGIIQEVRAKRTLDRLAVLNTPRVNVRREGQVSEIAVEHIVPGDLIELKSGDQIVADGRVAASGNLEIDESLLTGESLPIRKKKGDEVHSGSFVTAGAGSFTVSRVGMDTYARRLTHEARRFGLARSELLTGINRFLRYVTWAMVAAAPLLFLTQLHTAGSLRALLPLVVAGLVGMVPQGLVLLTTVAFAVSAVALGRRRVLVQELPAVEGLARVDVICFDKTGTLTENEFTFSRLEKLDGQSGMEEALRAFGDGDSPNATTRALATAFPSRGDPPKKEVTVPFSSERRWSSIGLDGGRAWVLGAPEVLTSSHALLGNAAVFAESGFRVLLLGSTKEAAASAQPPRDLSPAALLLFEERIRKDAPAAIRYFQEQGVALKIMSGDNPKTVGAACARAGFSDFGEVIDAKNLPEDPGELRKIVENHAVFGRVSPQQKRDMIRALQANGHVVAMNGDGINDVLALKAADLGIAMGNGAPATKAVAQVILLDSKFSALPLVVAEGRKITANIERVANLFLAKTVYVAVLAAGVGVLLWPFPFLPRHLTLIDTFTIGVPAFFLSLAPNTRRYRSGFVQRVFRFVVPAGFLAAAATLASYQAARAQISAGPGQSSTAAFLALGVMGFWILGLLSRPFTWRKRILLGSMAMLFTAIMLTPWIRGFFALELLNRAILWDIAAITAVCIGLLELLREKKSVAEPLGNAHE